MRILVVLAILLGLTFAQDEPSTVPGPPPPPGPNVNCDDVEEFGYVPSPVDCSTYYQCIQNIPFLLSCPRGLYFSPTELRCMSPDEANCVIDVPQPPTTPPSTSPLPPPGPNVNCDGVEEFGYVPSPFDCSTYYQCIQNIPFLLSCPRGLYFSPTELRCMSPNEANCVITIPPPPTTTQTPPGSISCDNVPNFRFIASPISCENYFQCIDGNAFLLACPIGLHFSESLQTCGRPEDINCELTSSTPPVSPTPPASATSPGPPPLSSCSEVENFRFIPDPRSCYQYFQCIDGTAFALRCPRGLYFSEIIQTCDFPAYVDCLTSPPPGEPTPPVIPPPRPSCDGVDNFRFIRDPFSCYQYFQCIDNELFLLRCPRGLYFNELIQTCDYPSNVDCVTLPIPTPPVSPTPPGPPPRPSCDDVENFRYIPNPFSCYQYFQCIDGEAFLLSCPRGLYFNEIIQTCDFPANVDCVTTPPGLPPTTRMPPPSEPSCEGVENGRLLSHPTSCAFYYQCVDGTPFLASCPINRYFNELIQGCAPSNEVDCEERTRRPTTTTIAPIVDPQCIGVQEGRLVRNPFSCTSYYQCLNGRAFPRFCDSGLWFDEDSQNCVEPELASCPNTKKICEGVEDETYIGSDT